jgi:hypothetical protein
LSNYGITSSAIGEPGRLRSWWWSWSFEYSSDSEEELSLLVAEIRAVGF